jgi:hypothetical protein
MASSTDFLALVCSTRTVCLTKLEMLPPEVFLPGDMWKYVVAGLYNSRRKLVNVQLPDFIAA